MNFYVYALIDPRTNIPFYIGKGSNNRKSFHTNQARVHLDNPRSLKESILVDILKQGLEPIEDVLVSGLSESSAYECEKMLIAKFGRKLIDGGILSNISPGGYGFSRIRGSYVGCNNPFFGKRHSNEAKSRISQSRCMWYKENVHPMQGKQHTSETKAKISAAKKGTLPWITGRSHTNETKLKISLALLGNQHRAGKEHNAETKLKISDSLKLYITALDDAEKQRRKAARLEGSKNSEKAQAYRKRLSEQKKEAPCSFKGRQHSEETKLKMREAALKRKERKQHDTVENT